jgi:hypothetical protein
MVLPARGAMVLDLSPSLMTMDESMATGDGHNGR